MGIGFHRENEQYSFFLLSNIFPIIDYCFQEYTHLTECTNNVKVGWPFDCLEDSYRLLALIWFFEAFVGPHNLRML